jgi:non-ribosomal peptide synthetase component F
MPATTSVTPFEAVPLHSYRSGAAVQVVATTVPGTRAAVRAATALANGLDSRVNVIAPRLPSDGSLDQQSAAGRAFAQEIMELPEAASARVRVLPCICRRLSDVVQLLTPRALVVIGGRSYRWWSSREQRLAHTLTAAGYRVLFVHADEEQPVGAP